VSFIEKLVKRITYVLPRILLVSIFFLYVVFAFLSYFDYFEPYLYPLVLIRGEAHPLSRSIIVGPYPHYEEMKKLKEKFGVEMIVSLLNVKLPQEKALYERERRDSERLGLKTFNFPMEYLPVDSDSNKERLTELIAFLRSHSTQKVYIHCYLGKHRIGFVRTGLIQNGIANKQKTQ
jgi:protein-tyrosine phosphatase